MSACGQGVPIWAIVPAAGLGRRMGSPKQILPYCGSTMTGTVTRSLLQAGVAGVVVVTRASLVRDLDLPEDRGLRIALNEDTGSDMVDSVRIGLRVIHEATSFGEGSESMSCDVGVLVVPGDMPAVSVKTFRVCIAAFVADPSQIVVAKHGERRGHPIIFPLAMRLDVDKLDGGLNELPKRHADRVHLVAVSDSSVTRDVNTPEEYERLMLEDAGEE